MDFGVGLIDLRHIAFELADKNNVATHGHNVHKLICQWQMSTEML